MRTAAACWNENEEALFVVTRADGNDWLSCMHSVRLQIDGPKGRGGSLSSAGKALLLEKRIARIPAMQGRTNMGVGRMGAAAMYNTANFAS